MESAHTNGDSPASEAVLTRVLHIDTESFEDAELAEAVTLIKDGEIVAFPTETVYGLGANALNGEACKKIFRAKRRPADNPLICHISSMEMLPMLVSHVPENVRQLLERSHFWPGPLTILFPKNENVPDEVTAGLDTVGVRMPSHPIAKKLIELAGVPIAAPSANSSGRPSPTSASHVLDDLSGRVRCVIDGGSTNVGVESTVIDMSRDPPVILRPGGITHEQLAAYLPGVTVYGKEGRRDLRTEEKPPTPGLKYRHYSPNARVVLFDFGRVAGDSEKRAAAGLSMKRRVEEEARNGNAVGVIKTQHDLDTSPCVQAEDQKPVLVHRLGESAGEGQKAAFAAEVAKGLFGALRGLDARNVDVIIVEGIEEEHAGLAVMNRLRKAAAEVVADFS